MSKTSPARIRTLASALLLFLLPTAASAVQHEVRIFMDLDDDAGTGCLVNTVDGPFDGVEQILITTVETTTPPDAATVTDVAISDCVDEMTDTFGAPASFDGGWPVGIDNGVGGRDVVETYFPLISSVVDSPMTARLGVVVTDENGGDQALLTTDDTPDGPPILIVIDQVSVLEIPTLGEWGLLLLALLLAGGSFWLLGRRGSVALAVVLVLLAAGTAWAAVNLDGLTTEWTPADQLASDGIVLFGMVEGGSICFRVDVDLVFNGGPEAVDDAYATDEDTPLSLPAPGVLANDSDPDSDPIQVSTADGASAQGAAVTVNSDGSFSYDPTASAALQALAAGEMVADTFSYTIEDGNGGSDSATVTVTVTGVNDPPTAMPDMYMATEDTLLSIPAPGVLVNDDDVDASDTLSAVLDTDVSNGTLSLAADGSFTYMPGPDFTGMDSFTYHASDGIASSPTVTATITVSAVNDGPNAVDDMFMTGEDTPLNIADPGLLTNDTDPEMDPLTVTAFDATSTQGATVTVNAGGGFTYDPTGAAALQGLAAMETVDDTFTYTIEDPSGDPDTATVTVTVTGVDDAPDAVDDAATVAEDSGASAVDVLANDTDVDGGPISVASVSQPTNGTVVITGGGTGLTYQPDPNYCNDGSPIDDFTYTLTPGGDVATVRVTVTCLNDPPTADDETITAVCNLEHVVEADPGETAAGSAPVFRTIADNVLDGDSDPVEGSAISIVQADGATSDTTAPFDITTNEGGTATLYADGSFVYTPEGGDRSVSDSFTYTIQDADGGQATGTVNLNVGAVCVWFVDNSTGADDTGTGTSSDPFTSLVDEIGPDATADDAEDASLAGDVVYVFTGDSTTGDPYAGGYTAQANERVLGEGVDLVVDLGSGPETLFDSTPNTPPLVDAAGDAFTVSDVTGVEIAGFEIDAGDNALDFEAPATGAGATFHDNTVTASAGPAILANPVAGASQLSVVDNDITSSDQGVDVDAPVATLDVVVDGNTFTTDDTGVDLNGAGTRVTSICGNTVSGDSGNHGIALENVLLDADPGTVAFDQITCAQPTTVGAMGNPVPRHGITLDTVRGDLDLGQVTVHSGTAGGLDDLAFSVTGDGIFNAGAGTGFQLTTTGGTVHAVDGPALRFIDVDLQNMVLTTVTVDASSGEGVQLEGVTGSLVTNGGDSSIEGTGGEAFYVVDTPATGLSVTYDGSIDMASSAGAVLIENHPAGTVTFDGASIVATAGDGLQFVNADGTYQITTPTTLNGGDAGVDIVNGSGGSFTFTDTDVTSPTGPGIRIDGSGPSSVSFGANSSLTYATAGQPAVVLSNRSAGIFTYSGTVNATSGTGLQFDDNDGTTTTFNSTVTLNGGDAGIDIVNGSSGSYTFSNTTITSPTGFAFNVDSSSGGITWSAGGVTQNNAATAVRFNSHGSGIVNISAPVTGNTSTANAVDLTGTNGGIYNFRGGLDLDTTTGTAFNATGGGTVNVCTDSLCTGTGTAVTSTVDTTGAATAGVNFVNTVIGTSGVTFATVNVDGAADGINLTNAGSGGFAALGGTIQDVTARGVDVSGGSGDVTVDASIDTTTSGRSVEVTTHTGGVVDFNGFIDDDGMGIRMENNVGSILRFDGGMDVDTAATAGTEEGFQATGGGVVHVTGTNDVNTSLATGIAVNIASGTTIGSDDVTFRNVSANGAANGIVLSNTGTAGDFTVTGDGGVVRNASGGTVTNTTGDAVSVTNANNVTLEQMNITNCGDGTAGDDCIDVVGGNGITVSAVRVENAAGTGANEDFGNGLRLTDVTGTSRVDLDSLFTNFPVASTHAVRMRNTDTDGDLTLDDSSFTAQGAGNSATYVTVQSFGSSDIDFTVTNDCQFTGLRGDAILSAAGEAPGATGTVTTLIEGSDFLNAAANGSGAIAMTVSQSGATQSFTVDNNVFQNLSTTLAAPVGIVTANAANGGGTLSGTISGNTIDPNSGTRRGIQIVGQTTSAAAIVGTVNVTIDDNDIDRIPASFAILTDVDDGIGNSTINITNNRIGQLAGSPGAIGDDFDGAVLMRVRGTPAATVNTTLSGNNIRANVPMGGRIVYIDARDSRTANFDILDNTIRNDGAGALDPEFYDRVLGAANNVCMNLKNNNAIDSTGAAGSGDYDLNEGSGTVTVEGLATVTADNLGTFAIEAGISNSADCIP